MSIKSLRYILLLIVAGCFAAGVGSCGGVKDKTEPDDFVVSFVPKPWEVNVEREYLQLADGWKFFKGKPLKIKSFETLTRDIVDPKEYVLRDGTKKAIGEKCEKPYAAECDDSSWVTMNVPFNWYDLGKEMDEFVGTAWYRKKFDVSEEQLGRGRAVLRFEGVFYRAWIYVNGEKAGFHEGGYTPFEMDVTDMLKAGENLLAVRVSNAIDDGDIVIGDWWNYGGIHRPVYLEFKGETFVKDLTIKTELSDDLASAVVRFDTVIANPGAGGMEKVNYFIYDLNGDEKKLDTRVVQETGNTEKFTAEWKVENPRLWSPEEPNLYFVKIMVEGPREKVLDGFGEMFGIREFEVRGKELYLNSKKVFFRGVNRHDEKFHGEFPDAGRVMTEAERIEDFQLIKDMGGNSMRTGHYVNNRASYYMTDRLGIMVIEEGGPTGGPLNEDFYIDKLKTQLTEMYVRDKNHASIVMWSIGNEFGGDKYLKYIKASAELMRSLDDRPLTFTETSSREVKEGYNYVDVLSRNEYIGWYGGGITPTIKTRDLGNFIKIGLVSLLQQYHGEYPDKPIFIMEFGAESICGQHAENPKEMLSRGDEEYQEYVYRTQYKILLEKNYVVGTFPWIISDFKTKSDHGTCQFTPHLNRKGLTCTDRSKKRAYTLVQKVYESIAKEYGNEK